MRKIHIMLLAGFVPLFLPSLAAAEVACERTNAMNVRTERLASQITVRWDAVEGTSVYTISWSPANAGGFTEARVTNGELTFTITGLNSLLDYNISVRADTSLTCSTTVLGGGKRCPVGPLDVEVFGSDAELIVSWGAVADATDYKVEWSPAADDGTQSADGVTATMYKITGLTNGRQYRAAVTVGGSGPTCYTTGTPREAAIAAPAMPAFGLIILMASIILARVWTAREARE